MVVSAIASTPQLSSGEYLPGSLQGKISSDGCLKKRTNGSVRYCQYTS
ncbi:hypothetical protein Asd1617_05070 [Shigella dysenteriae 1617]|nr:hypothetical protein Asd1617_00457 [Shigella dysenteriae 1617]AHA66536.1 hypothetical protein Asd1617_03709 [Shigella dysenteriae 1617]AHA67897.1 hypothetical protein Asd1617_05070 [Shigella dysenteriae 1617]